MLAEIIGYFTSFGLLETVLLIVGLGLMIVEIFVPGFGVAGISGLVCLIFGVVLKAKTLAEALLLLLALAMVLTVGFLLVLRSAKSGRLSRSSFVLKQAATREEGFSSNDEMGFFVGRRGTVRTDLRPAGTAEFDGVRLDVVTQGEYIEAGAHVEVVKVEGRRIVVVSVPEEIPADKKEIGEGL